MRKISTELKQHQEDSARKFDTITSDLRDLKTKKSDVTNDVFNNSLTSPRGNQPSNINIESNNTSRGKKHTLSGGVVQAEYGVRIRIPYISFRKMTTSEF